MAVTTQVASAVHNMAKGKQLRDVAAEIFRVQESSSAGTNCYLLSHCEKQTRVLHKLVALNNDCSI